MRAFLSRAAGVALLLAALAPGLAPSAKAVTSDGRPVLAWTGPGAQTCGDLCDRRWALDRMRAAMPQRVHDEFARRVRAGADQADYHLQTGDLILAMSYAREGAPDVDFTKRVAQLPPGLDYPAVGHAVAHDGRVYRFIRVAASGDWALIVDRPGPASPAGRQTPQVGHRGPAGLSGIAFGGGGGGGSGEPLMLVTDPTEFPQEPDRTAPLPIPLPGALALLAGALAALAGARLLRRPVGPA